MEDPTTELPTVATIIGCPETLSDTKGLVATPLGVPSADGSEDAIQKALLENMCSGFISKKDRDVIYCDVCEVSCTGDQAYKAHVAGSKHAKKLKDHKAPVKIADEPFIYEDPYTNTYECTLCQVKLNAKNQIAAHVSGTKHKNRLTPNEKIYKAAPRQMPYRQDMSAALLYCPTCDVHANSDLQMEQHMTSAKHVNKVNGGGAVAPPNRRQYASPLLSAGGTPGRFMPYPYRERDPRDLYDYDDYDRREYFREERDYDYEYPREGGGGYWSRGRLESRYMEERIRDICAPPGPRGYNQYLRDRGRGGYGDRSPYGERPPAYSDRPPYGGRPLPPNPRYPPMYSY